jgi:hypothetical protein
MKTALFVFSMISFQVASAAIGGSDYHSRHQEIIEKFIRSECGIMRDLHQISSQEKVIVIDQGIRDVEYVTVLSGVQRIDQGIFDSYKIKVKSEFHDMYDHSSNDWGAYSVSSVTCELK